MMLRLSLRNLVAHKLRLILTVAAVTVGVAFVPGTLADSGSTPVMCSSSPCAGHSEIPSSSRPARPIQPTACGSSPRARWKIPSIKAERETDLDRADGAAEPVDRAV